MKEIIDWLITIELMAADVYSSAADYFKSDEKKSAFFKWLADEEAYHFHIMGSASDYLRKSNISVSKDFLVDEKTKKNVLGPLIKIKEKLLNKNLSVTEAYEAVIDAELSEWNDIFHYVVDILKSNNIHFQTVASKMQKHLDGIKKHIELTAPEISSHKLEEISPVWEKQVLIVDDNDALRKLMHTVNQKYAMVTEAENGKSAIDLVQSKFYDVVISDIDMPIMDGIDFFNKSMEVDPEIASRFIFVTSDCDRERIDFFKKNKIQYLHKPFAISILVEMVKEILDIPEV